MYQVSDVLQKINEYIPLVVLLALFPWVGGFVQIFEALRLGFTQRVAGQPIATTVIMLDSPAGSPPAAWSASWWSSRRRRSPCSGGCSRWSVIR